MGSGKRNVHNIQLLYGVFYHKMWWWTTSLNGFLMKTSHSQWKANMDRSCSESVCLQNTRCWGTSNNMWLLSSWFAYRFLALRCWNTLATYERQLYSYCMKNQSSGNPQSLTCMAKECWCKQMQPIKLLWRAASEGASIVVTLQPALKLLYPEKKCVLGLSPLPAGKPHWGKVFLPITLVCAFFLV